MVTLQCHHIELEAHAWRRKAIPNEVQKNVLIKSRRRCCLCFGLEGRDEDQKGQIAHLDGDNENAAEDNLAFLCFDHHDEFDGTTRLAKGLREDEVKHWRDHLYRAKASADAAKASETSGIPKLTEVNPFRQLCDLALRIREEELQRDATPRHQRPPHDFARQATTDDQLRELLADCCAAGPRLGSGKKESNT